MNKIVELLQYVATHNGHVAISRGSSYSFSEHSDWNIVVKLKAGSVSVEFTEYATDDLNGMAGKALQQIEAAIRGKLVNEFTGPLLEYTPSENVA